MHNNQIEDMSKQIQEDAYTEFKSSFNDGVIESLSAFANTKGGRVLVGVANNGQAINGFSIGGETLQKWVNEVKNETQPSVIPDVNIIQAGGLSIGELEP